MRLAIYTLLSCGLVLGCAHSAPLTEPDGTTIPLDGGYERPESTTVLFSFECPESSVEIRLKQSEAGHLMLMSASHSTVVSEASISDFNASLGSNQEISSIVNMRCELDDNINRHSMSVWIKEIDMQAGVKWTLRPVELSASKILLISD